MMVFSSSRFFIGSFWPGIAGQFSDFGLEMGLKATETAKPLVHISELYKEMQLIHFKNANVKNDSLL